MENFNFRLQTETVDAKKVTEVYFSNVKQPNVFWIKNLSDANLYVGINFVPNNQSFHKRVLPYSDEVIANPIKTDRIFIYNDGSSKANLEIYSDKIDTFDYMLLKKNTDCVIQGMKEDFALSVEDDILKKVLIDNPDFMLRTHSPEILELLNRCKQDDFFRVKEKPTENFLCGTVTDISTIGSSVKGIVFISNDAETDVTLTFAGNSGKQFVLKSGEVLNDISNLIIDSVTFGLSGETVNCRYFLTE